MYLSYFHASDHHAFGVSKRLACPCSTAGKDEGHVLQRSCDENGQGSGVTHSECRKYTPVGFFRFSLPVVVVVGFIVVMVGCVGVFLDLTQSDLQ